jgi:hypothetical protein
VKVDARPAVHSTISSVYVLTQTDGNESQRQSLCVGYVFVDVAQ